MEGAVRGARRTAGPGAGRTRPDGSPAPLLIAHRGASGHRPEHTAAAYELAVALGADAVEPDLVVTADGVLVVRHENELSGTTDVAARPEFAARRRTTVVDGHERTGWFTEDFTWAELSTLHARERLPELRPLSATFDGRYPVLRFADVVALLRDATTPEGLPVVIVAEIKHAAYFESIGLPIDRILLRELADTGLMAHQDRLVVESFEKPVLDRLAGSGLRAKRILLIEHDDSSGPSPQASGTPTPPSEAARQLADRLPSLAEGRGDSAEGAHVDGVSVEKSLLLGESEDGRSPLVDAAHALGLDVFCWTLRPENGFLDPAFRRPATAVGDWWGEFSRLLASGVDGVFADHPDLVDALRRERDEPLPPTR